MSMLVRLLLRMTLSKLRGSKAIPKGVLENVNLAASMLREMMRGRYRMSRKTTLSLIFALLYFLIPTDVIVDFVPLVGYIDDAAVLTYVLKNLADEVERFKATQRKIEIR